MKKTLTIAHISDIHIYNRRYHKEFLQVANKLYTKIVKQRPDHILISGDIFHVKGTMSPEAVQIAGDFFRSLADLAPTIVTVGNHDCLQSNLGRLDSISPIISALDHPDLTYAKYTQIIELSEDYDLTILGILDENEWENVKPRDNGKTHLVTFHGSVTGVTSDTGWVLDHGDIDFEVLTQYDYGLLGDIHESQSVNEDERFRYAGSLCQNNHGEKNNKGYLLWRFGIGDEWQCSHHHIPNPKPFMTIELTEKGNLPRSANPPEGARLRIVANHLISLDKIRKSMDVARSKFNPESLAFVNKAGTKKSDVNLDGITNTENLRDPKVQQQFIGDYLKDYDPDPDTLKRVFELNGRLNTLTNIDADIMRNVRWNLQSVEWDNTFNYGKRNKVNYEKLDGVVGLFGPNRSGKCVDKNTLIEVEYDAEQIRRLLGYLPDKMKKMMTIGEVYEIFLKHGSRLGMKVSTPYGYRKIEACAITAKQSKIMRVTTQGGKTLDTSPDHLIKTKNGQFQSVVRLLPGDIIQTITGNDAVLSTEMLPHTDDLYDIQVAGEEQYYSNGIVSHNSSVLDTLLYCLYNTTSKNNRKNFNIINQTQPYCSARAKIEANGKIYTIERKSEKYEKKLKGHITLEAKTYVEFSVEDPSTGETTNLNGADRNATDKEIRKIFGTIDDFLLTSMSSQMDGLRFINEGSTERKKILARFLDLEIFENKFKVAKDESVDIRALLKKYEENTFDEDTLTLTQQLATNEQERENQRSKCDTIKGNIATLTTTRQDIQSKLDAVPIRHINIAQERQSYTTTHKQITTLAGQLGSTMKQKLDLLTSISRQQKERDEINEEELTTKFEELEKYEKQKQALTAGISKAEHELKILSKSTKVLGDVPCNDGYPTCPLLKNAHTAKQKTEKINKGLMMHKDSLENLVKNIDLMNPERLRRERVALVTLSDSIAADQRSLSERELRIEKMKVENLSLDSKLKEIQGRIATYEENKEAIEGKEELLQQIVALDIDIQAGETELGRCDTKILDLVKSHGSLEQQIVQIAEKKAELLDLREKYTAYDLMMRVLHPNGVSYQVIKSLLPLINDEINKVLANVAEFQILMSADGKKLDVQIKHPKYEPRAIEMASGAEKSLAGLALRIALTNVSTLPRPSIMILDEPATALDDEGMVGFARVLDLCKSYYDKVILITHLQALKDSADCSIDIERRGSFAYISQ